MAKPEKLDLVKQRVRDLDENWRKSGKPDIFHVPRSKFEQKSKENSAPMSEVLDNSKSIVSEEIKKL